MPDIEEIIRALFGAWILPLPGGARRSALAADGEAEREGGGNGDGRPAAGAVRGT